MSDPREPIVEDGEFVLDEDQEAEDTPADDEAGDAEGEDADGAGRDEEVEGQAEDVDRPPRQSRRASREQSLSRQLAEERQSRERLDREFQEFRTQARAPAYDPAAAARAAEEERRRVADMLPHEAAEYWHQKTIQDTRNMLAQSQYQNFEAQDRRAYADLKRTNPAAARLEGEVERQLTALRAQGIYTFSREDILKHRLGDEVLSKRQTALPRQQRAAQRRVAGQTTRPANGRGDTARDTGGGRQLDADERLLRGIRAGDLI